MDIKVGEYTINLNRLIIGQVIEIDNKRQEATIRIIGKNIEIQTGFWNIRKHSFNIIDLIEVGDIVNGFCVTEIGNSSVFVDANYDDVCGEIYKTDIQTILTHEQYVDNCYEVKGE